MCGGVADGFGRVAVLVKENLLLYSRWISLAEVNKSNNYFAVGVAEVGTTFCNE